MNPTLTTIAIALGSGLVSAALTNFVNFLMQKTRMNTEERIRKIEMRRARGEELYSLLSSFPDKHSKGTVEAITAVTNPTAKANYHASLADYQKDLGHIEFIIVVFFVDLWRQCHFLRSAVSSAEVVVLSSGGEANKDLNMQSVFDDFSRVSELCAEMRGALTEELRNMVSLEPKKKTPKA